MSAELTLVIPTFNEVENVPRIVDLVATALPGVHWEIIFVDDDSPDGTAHKVRELGRTRSNVRCLQRIGRRGLSTACIEGMLASNSPFLGVMDADMQHDERLLPQMLETLKSGDCSFVVGTRYAAGGGVGDWSKQRAAMSRIATRLANIVCKREVSDPMSGFFMLRREVLDQTVRGLSGAGFKLLLDMLSTSDKNLVVKELPYTFRNREFGESKLDSMVLWEFGMLLADKLVGRYVPVRFLFFLLVGAAGLVVHMLTLTALLQGVGVEFIAAQTAATFLAMVFNFSVNNVLTYRDMRLRGWKWWRGLVTFCAACSLGGAANVGIASYLFQNQTQWAIAAVAGIVVGAVWNYVVTQLYTWGKRSA